MRCIEITPWKGLTGVHISNPEGGELMWDLSGCPCGGGGGGGSGGGGVFNFLA